MWEIGEQIGDREKRMDVCIAAAGILKSHTDCLEYPESQFRQVSNQNDIPYPASAICWGKALDCHSADKGVVMAQVMDVNVNGVLFTAQAAGRQMARFGSGGSIVLIASMSGSITNKVRLPQTTVNYSLSRTSIFDSPMASQQGMGLPSRPRLHCADRLV